MEPRSDGLVLELQTVVPAPPAVVFAAFSDPSELVRWWGPKGFSVPGVELHAGVGATYRIEMQPPDGDPFFLTGEFREVDPPVRLGFTFVWEDPDPDDVETLVDLSFVALGEATEITLRQGMFRTEERRALHRDGWSDSFDKLQRLLAGRRTSATAPAVRLGLNLFGLEMLVGGDLRRIVDVVVLAEELGFERVVISDHVVIGLPKDYPYEEFPVPVDYPFLDPLIGLASIGGATTRIRLTTGIVIAPLRPAALLAKMAASLDVLCGGRLDLGVGTGWQRSEYDAVGVDFDARGRIFDDTMRACVALWRTHPASFSSEWVSFDDVHCMPQPVQPGGVPIWVGGPASRRTARRVAEFGAGWIVASADPITEELRRGRERVAEAMDGAGRDPGSTGIMVPAPLINDDRGQPSLERSLAVARDYADVGITDLTLTVASMMPASTDPMSFLEALPARCAELGFALRPSTR